MIVRQKFHLYPAAEIERAKVFVRAVINGWGQQISDDDCFEIARKILDNLRTR